ncbi:hypothetical protein BDV95DRAFT_670926 [Massariosphaeria phaeospora]|uniref:Uncharacterized protein n=1 Tax=Massariosphaeria phaeospora TaxID=100035 RepID=A0A7C8M3C8_9PLEO|nr:hypothetical protein BDV95DRAFT_670926 [Massariosphaeria phaeospora]
MAIDTPGVALNVDDASRQAICSCPYVRLGLKGSPSPHTAGRVPVETASPQQRQRPVVSKASGRWTLDSSKQASTTPGLSIPSVQPALAQRPVCSSAPLQATATRPLAAACLRPTTQAAPRADSRPRALWEVLRIRFGNRLKLLYRPPAPPSRSDCEGAHHLGTTRRLLPKRSSRHVDGPPANSSACLGLPNRYISPKVSSRGPCTREIS